MSRRGGIITLQTNGKVMDAVGDFTVNYGQPKREALVGADRVHGYKETPQVASISGAIRDDTDLDIINDILNFTDGTVTLKLSNGKTAMVEDAFYALEGDMTTEEGQIPVKFEGRSGTEVPA